jgi:hypothetical protein
MCKLAADGTCTMTPVRCLVSAFQTVVFGNIAIHFSRNVFRNRFFIGRFLPFEVLGLSPDPGIVPSFDTQAACSDCQFRSHDEIRINT